MIYVFNKNKMLSYVLASCFVLMLFAFQDSVTKNRDIELVKVSSNVVEDVNTIDNMQSNIKNGFFEK